MAQKPKGEKIANSFYLPKYSFLRWAAGLMGFAGSQGRDFTEQILARSDADAIRADWEAVGESLQWAIDEYEKEIKRSSPSE